MRLAILSDIHANREAMEACLADVARRGADRIVLLGDLVGYGADPAFVVDRAREMVAAGAIAIMGNHDEAAVGAHGGMNAAAEAAAAWTRGALDEEARGFLRRLPMEEEQGDILFVHADASDPEDWRYVQEAEDARRSLGGTEARVVISGHTHVPALFGLTAAAKLVAFRPVTDVPVPLTRPRRWQAVLGAVGQPRDGDPAACWGMLDTDAPSLTWHRVPYDVAAAAEKIRAAGLPEVLAQRLFRGR